MDEGAQVIEQTKKWIQDVVIGCNLCPFAAAVVKKQSVFYTVREDKATSIAIVLRLLENAFNNLDTDESIETGFLIFPAAFKNFMDYLQLLQEAERFLKHKKYNGIYQIASFHPLYCFSGSAENDAANYTNRSPYPMLHLLRESSIDKALEHYPQPDEIPIRNIAFARNKGLAYMKMLRDACL